MKKIYKIKIIIIFFVMLILPLTGMAAECPRASVDIIPKDLAQPKQDMTFLMRSEGFSPNEEDMRQTHYAWCIDDVFLGTINAGSKDKFVGSIGENYLESEYGDIRGNFSDVCNPVSRTLDAETDFVEQFIFAGDSDAMCLKRDYTLYCNDENLDKINDRNPLIINPIADTIRVYYEDPNETYDYIDIGRIPYDEYIVNAPPPSNFFIERESGVDSDGDGMNDKWEIKYFKGRKINAKIETEDGGIDEISFHMPNEDDAILPLVQADRVISPDDPEIYSTDPDGDAWEYQFAVWTFGVPFLKSSSSDEIINPGLKSSSNILAEYIIGTDPLNPDTDKDGIMDMSDYAGRMQDNTHMTINQDYGYRYKIMARMWGVNGDYSDGDESEKYVLVTYPLLEDSMIGGESLEDCKLEPTPEGENEFEVGAGLPIKVGWGYRPSPPVRREINEPIIVTAEYIKAGGSSGLDLDFKWFLNKEPREGESGKGKQYFQFIPDKEPCEDENVTLEIHEENGRMSSQDLPIRIGFDTNLKTTVIGNVDLKNEIAVDFNQHTGADLNIDDLNNPEGLDFLIEGADPFKDLINAQVGEKTFRKGDLVKVEVGNLAEQYDNTHCVDEYGEFNNTDDDEKHGIEGFDFLYNFKMKEQIMQNGPGLNFSKALFILKGDSRTLGESTGQESDSLLNESRESVDFELIDPDGRVMARNNLEFPVAAPSVQFIEVDGVTVGTSRDDSNKLIYSANRGDDITVRAGLRYFRPSGGFSVNWKRDDLVVNEGTPSGETVESVYTFRAGYNINGTPNEISHEKIEIDVESDLLGDTGSGGGEESANNSLSIELRDGEDSATDVAIGGFIQNFVPQYYKGIFNIVLASGAAGIVMLFVLSFMKKTEGK
ncbi:MAG: hypothetical protein HQ538_00800 [Parcubacteria group bacterium]|nr:hypothetical protein [Parcubacteria group bacterium]